MNRIKVDSSNLVSVGHDPKTNTLEVEFKGGKVYQYRPVTSQQYEALTDAASIGTHFAANIRNNSAIAVSQV